jgi:hypothetical protein
MICLASLVYPIKVSSLTIQRISVGAITAEISPVVPHPPVKLVQIPAGESDIFDIGGLGVSLALVKDSDGEKKSVPYESLIYTVAYPPS